MTDGAYCLPPQQEQLRRRAIKLEWLTVFFISFNILLLYLVLGNSQAMRTAWFEDMLSLVPPIAFLIATHFETKPPDSVFPYGYFRSINVAYLASSIAILAFGLLLIFESVNKLVKTEHPSIGTIVIFDQPLWLGWLMIAALITTTISPIVLGRLKLRVARRLQDKALFADAEMNKADWMTGLAAVVGVGGIGLGLWWADSAAALLIALDITHDGLKNLRRVGRDLLDSLPRQVDSDEISPVVEKALNTLKSLDWVEECEIRLRPEGHVFSGDARVVPKQDVGAENLVERIEDARQRILDVDWRLYDLQIMPARRLGKAKP